MLADEVTDDLVDIVLDGVNSQCVREVLAYLVRDGQLQRACYLKEMMVPAVKAMRAAAVEEAMRQISEC